MKYIVKFIPNMYPEECSKIQVTTIEDNQRKSYFVKDKTQGMSDWAKKKIRLSAEDDGNSVNIFVPATEVDVTCWSHKKRNLQLDYGEVEYLYAALSVLLEDYKVKMKRKEDV